MPPKVVAPRAPNNILIQLKPDRRRPGRIVCYICTPRYNYAPRHRDRVAIPAVGRFDRDCLNAANGRGAFVYDPPRGQVLRDLIDAVAQMRSDIGRNVPVAYNGPDTSELPLDWHRGAAGVLLLRAETTPYPDISELSRPVVAPGTQAAVVAEFGLDPVTLGGHVIDGMVFKPDATAAPTGSRCARCGTTAAVAWIAGAGEALCARHQDDY